MSEKIDYSKGVYDAKKLGTGRMFILGVQHMFAMFGATVLVPLLTGLMVGVGVARVAPLGFAEALQHCLVHRGVGRIIQIEHKASCNINIL